MPKRTKKIKSTKPGEISRTNVNIFTKNGLKRKPASFLLYFPNYAHQIIEIMRGRRERETGFVTDISIKTNKKPNHLLMSTVPLAA